MAGKEVIEIGPVQANSWLQTNNAILLDVREDSELEVEWIPGATTMPLSKLNAETIAELTVSKVVIICLTGRRSKEAGKRLLEQGIHHVYSVKDGLLAWNAAGLETVNQSALLI